MALAPGTRLGAYEVVALLGSGGMGEVYRARDTRLDRMVAIKILNDTHSDLGTRFAREAKAIAALAHPHICTLFDIGHDQGADYLVMEYLEGETLAARLGRGPLSLAQALHYAVQMVSALATAHRADIVHRDLKPANVMLVKGDAKLLDFGLAKYAPGTTDATETITAPGMIMGTVPYMAPEQLEGRPADTRTDVFAFGAVLYEMLTGTRAFASTTQAGVIAAILDREPASLAVAVPSVPLTLERLVKRCLAKDPDERWQSTSDLTSELRWIEEASSEPASQKAVALTTLKQTVLKTPVSWAAAVLVALVVGLMASAAYHPRAPVDPAEMRLQIAAPGGPAEFAISPDGRHIVLVGAVDGRRQLLLRALAAETARPLPGTDNAFMPFWSPDSRSIGFFANGQLKRIEADGGPVLALASAPNGLGGTWNADGVILFTPRNTSPVHRVPAAGGDALPATRLGPPGITDQWYPYFLPDGRHFLFYGWGTPEQKGVYLGSLDSKDVSRLIDTNSTAVFAPPDRVLYARQGALVAQRVNMTTYAPTGNPQTVAERVVVNNNCGQCAAVSASVAGPIVYQAGAAVRQLAWVDSSGQEVGSLGAPDDALRTAFRLSPDGRSLAFTRDDEYTDIWLLDTTSGVSQRFTFDTANKYSPVWSPDGRRIVFSWDPKGDLDLYEKPVNGTGNGTLLWPSSEHKHAQDWSRDGRFILYMSDSATTGWDLWALPLVGEKKPLLVANTSFNEVAARVSPDGRWVAYQSDETGRPEVYIQPFPGSSGKKQITSGGGTSPRWRRDGRELSYFAPGSGLMAVPIAFGDSAVQTGKPVALFKGGAIAASPDGQRFLIIKTVKEAAPITVLLNWKPK